MKQEIRFCSADDGVRIAYSLAGAGSPVVKAANWLNHLEFDWESPIWRHTLEAIARRHLLVRYDERGNGLSDWKAADLSFDAWVRDLETVVDAAGLDRFALFGISQGCALSVAYTVRHPERVSKLVLHGGYGRGWRAREDADEIEMREAMHVLMAKGWGTNNPAFRQIFTSRFVPGATPEQMTWFNDLQRMTTSPDNAVRLSKAASDIDVLELLPRLQVPTLVLHSRGDAVVPFEAGRVLAAGIAGSRFVPLESQNHVILGQEPVWEKYIEEILAFLDSHNPVLSEHERVTAKGHVDDATAVDAFSRADRIFDRVLDVPEDERSAWLARECGADRELRVKVERLLAASDRTHDGLRTGGGMAGSLGVEVATELHRTRDLSVGDELGAYTIVGQLGRGGMGTVYRARHQGLEREVAVKALPRVVGADPSQRRRFEREAKLLASLDHPSIATVHDLLFVEEKPYLVMELVEGRTLTDDLTEGPLAIHEVVRIASQLVDALEEAHRARVVHRDLKPSNVMLTKRGRVKVLDFGLAKSMVSTRDGASDVTTRAGMMLGTPGYMSPEQARGEEADARADHWAFGCIVYEMLTGERAFGGHTASDAIAAVLRDEVDWERLPPATPPALVELLERCLAHDREARFQDIGEARRLLEASEPLAPTAHGSESRFWGLVLLSLIALGLVVYVLAT